MQLFIKFDLKVNNKPFSVCTTTRSKVNKMNLGGFAKDNQQLVNKS